MVMVNRGLFVFAERIKPFPSLNYISTFQENYDLDDDFKDEVENYKKKLFIFYLFFSLRGDCRDAALDPLYWISYKSGR